MSDVRFIKNDAILDITAPPYIIRRIDGVDFVEITSSGGFLETSAVLADGQRVRKYMVMSDTLLYVQLSEVRDLTSIVVYGALARGSRETQLNVEITSPAGLAEGVEQLRQRVVKVLLTTSGSSAFDEYGGGLSSLVGNPMEKTRLATEVLRRVRQVELQLTRAPGEDPARMLRSIEVLSITSIPPDGVRVSLLITNVAGQETTTEV